MCQKVEILRNFVVNNRIFDIFEIYTSKIIYGKSSGDYDKQLPRKGAGMYRSLKLKGWLKGAI